MLLKNSPTADLSEIFVYCILPRDISNGGRLGTVSDMTVHYFEDTGETIMQVRRPP